MTVSRCLPSISATLHWCKGRSSACLISARNDLANYAVSEEGAIAKGVFSLTESLESLLSSLLFFRLWGSLESVESLERKWTFVIRPLFQMTPSSEPEGYSLTQGIKVHHILSVGISAPPSLQSPLLLFLRPQTAEQKISETFTKLWSPFSSSHKGN